MTKIEELIKQSNHYLNKNMTGDLNTDNRQDYKGRMLLYEAAQRLENDDEVLGEDVQEIEELRAYKAKYEELTAHIKNKAESNPSVHRYVNLVTFIDGQEDAK